MINIIFSNTLPLSSLHKKTILLFTEDKKGEVLKYKNKIFAGAIVPYLIYNGKLYKSGYLVIDLFENVLKISLFSLKEPFKFKFSKKAKSLFFLFDGFSIFSDYFFSCISGITKFLNVFGGGCGSRFYYGFPNIFFKGKFYEDACLACELKKNFFINLFHGFKVKYASFSPTKISSYGREILEINYEPALEYYKKIISKIEKKYINSISRDIFSRYPLGLISYRKGVLIKDIIDINKERKSIKLASGVALYEPLSLLFANKEDLIFADKYFIEKNKTKTKYGFIFSCFSRKEILKKDMKKEISLISKNFDINFGFLSIGELTNLGLGRNIIYNKTNLLVGLEKCS